MCGIIFSASRENASTFVRDAHLAQSHRGPDGGATHFEKVNGVWLGFAHQRLSIVDLSALGAQPMESHSKRSMIIFNGEIYNHRQLAQRFALGPLKSNSDTEVVLELIEKIGLEEACTHFNGMWAIIFLDRKTGCVTLSRDRFGKKPMNYVANSKGIFIASEVRSLASVPELNLRVNPVSVGRFFVQSLQNVDEETWVEGVKAFPPGHTGKIDLSGAIPTLRDFKPFWNPPLTSSIEHRDSGQWVEELRATVQDAVNLRIKADVPVGIALSGGLDSSIISSIATGELSQGKPGVGFFSAVNPGSNEDESVFVDIMEHALGRNINRFNLELNGDGSLFDKLALCNGYNDGPVPSFSNVLFYELMKKAKALGNTVILTGQGADEAFCGYRKYPFFYVSQLLKRHQYLKGLKTLLSFGLNSTVLQDLRYAELKRYIGKANTSVMGPAASEAYKPFSLGAGSNLAQRQWQDIKRFSVPYLCHYEDRMSMATSCEVRAPFLDYRVIELGLSMPQDLKLKSGWTKYALRKAFETDLPKEVTWRKDKKGFVNPQDKWLQTTLKPNVMDIMGNANHPIFTEGFVDQKAYLKLFEDYCGGDTRIWFREVFAPFSLAVWMDQITRISARLV